MIFIITVLIIFATIFLTSLFATKTLKKFKLKSNLQKEYQEGNKVNIVNTLLMLIEKDPYDFNSRLKLAKIYMELKNYREAVIQLNEVLKFGHGNPDFNEKEINYRLAECYMKLNDIKEAYKTYAIIRKIDPDDPNAYINLGRIEFERGNTKRAIAYMSKAHEINPEDKEIAKELGQVLIQAKLFTEAINVFQTALSNDPEDPETNYYMAELMSIYNNSKEAIKHYYKSKNDPRFTVKSLISIAKILIKFKKLEEANRVLSAALKFPQLKRDEMLDIRYEIGEVCVLQKDIQKAIQQWERILSYVSNYRDVNAKLEQYEQTKSNLNLRRYMMSSPIEFSVICKKIALEFAKNVVIIKSEQQKDSSVEILVQAIYKDASVTILFKFFRGASNIGQFSVREFYEKCRELKAKLGVCFTTSGYTDEAIDFSVGRVIELYDKNVLLRFLEKLR